MKVVNLLWTVHGFELHGYEPTARGAVDGAMKFVGEALGDRR